MIKNSKRNIRILAFFAVLLFVAGALYELYELNKGNIYTYLSGLLPSLILCCITILLLGYVAQILEERAKLKETLEERNSQLYTLSYEEYKERKVEVLHHMYDAEIAESLLKDSSDPILRPAGLIIIRAERLTHDQLNKVYELMNHRMVFAKMDGHKYLLICYQTTPKLLDSMTDELEAVGLTAKAAYISDDRSLYDVYGSMAKEE